MKFVCAMVGAAFVTVALAIPASAQDTVTLYSPLKYNHDQGRAFFDFQKGQLAKRGAPWDLAYGLLRAGEDFDWFQSSGAFGNRSVIKDLGQLNWTDYFVVPVIEPLAKLKPGEQRSVTIDVSGADGADGAPGAPGADADGVVRQRPTAAPHNRPPKHDGTPKIDPIFVKAIVGHLYAVHVVNDTRDYYVLFRVEALTRGDNCTISWRLAPAPVAETVQKQK
jgi:hypothetical protein